MRELFDPSIVGESDHPIGRIPAMEKIEISWGQIIAQLADHEDLTSPEAKWAMGQILGDLADKETIKSFLLGIQAKGETAGEVEALVEVMFEHCAPISVPGRAVDLVGTGGDGANTINISTTASIIAQAAGARVIKHGARAASSKSGAADLLEALGVNIDLDGAQVAACVEEVGIGFCFAPKFHPAMRFAAPARKELGQASVFNILGPLANPARPQAVAVGVSKSRVMPIMADVLRQRGAEGFLFRGDDGIDEITLSTTTQIMQVNGGAIRLESFDPRDLGIEYAPIESLAGGDAEFNAAVTLRIFEGEKSPARDAVLLNAAAALAAYKGDFNLPITEQIRAGYELAAAAVDSGAARESLKKWALFTQGFKSA
jgi:anthranilate phosphoribosyltransferase